MFPMLGLCVPVVRGGSGVDRLGVVTGVNAVVYGCKRGRVGSLFLPGLRRGVRLH